MVFCKRCHTNNAEETRLFLKLRGLNPAGRKMDLQLAAAATGLRCCCRIDLTVMRESFPQRCLAVQQAWNPTVAATATTEKVAAAATEKKSDGNATTSFY